MTIAPDGILRFQHSFINIIWETAGLSPTRTKRDVSNEHWHRRTSSHSLSIRSYWRLSAYAQASRITYHRAHLPSSASLSPGHSKIFDFDDLSRIEVGTCLVTTSYDNPEQHSTIHPGSQLTHSPDMAALQVMMVHKLDLLFALP